MLIATVKSTVILASIALFPLIFCCSSTDSRAKKVNSSSPKFATENHTGESDSSDVRLNKWDSVRAEANEYPSKSITNTKKAVEAVVVEALDRYNSSITESSHYIEEDLPPGYVKNGTVDYTRYLQAALRKYNNVVFPGFPILINDSGLTIGSNTDITFLKGSEIWLKPSSKKSYNILNLIEASNVTLNNPVIKGDRYSHIGTEGEFGMGIAIRGGKKIKIFNPKVSECWGDGIYIGQTKEDKVPKDILIVGAYLAKNRRDGISIISVDGLMLDNLYAGYQNGTKPMCGINFEPNNSDCEIKNVKIINPKTEYNNGSGLQIVLSNLFLANKVKKVDIDVLNHSDRSSKSFAFKTACNNRAKVPGGSVIGSIKVINPTWSETIGDRPLAFVTDQPSLNLTVTSPKVRKSNGIELDSGGIKAILNKHSNGNLRIL